MRDPIGPVGEFLVGTTAAIADQRDTVAKPARDHAIGKFERGIQFLGVLKLAKRQRGPLLGWRQIVACESVDMRRPPEHLRHPARVSLAITTISEWGSKIGGFLR